MLAWIRTPTGVICEEYPPTGSNFYSCEKHAINPSNFHSNQFCNFRLSVCDFHVAVN